ncbi:MAG TPA: hypothetical protein VFY55_00625 [Nitrososphaeraceae archaeon]|nr:hypothetical protein [Nitrososphaeraceae archaeon]
MGRTIPSYRIATEMKRSKWKIFRQRLDKKMTEKRFVIEVIFTRNRRIGTYWSL